MYPSALKQLILFSGLFVIFFYVAIHGPSWIQKFIFYMGILILSSIISWQLSKLLLQYLPQGRLSPLNKAVLITGCDQGFGHLLARKLYEQGFIVFAGCLIADGEGAKSLQSDYSPERMHVLRMDVTKEEDVAAAVRQVKMKLTDGKSLWAVVNNAGIGSNACVELEGMDTFEKIVAVNQLGVVRVTKAFLSLLRQHKGRVVVVTSGLGRVSLGGVVPYCMTKFAAVAFCEGLRREMWAWGVRVISIEPGAYRTNIIANDDLKSIAEKKWEAADSNVRDAYGRQYLEVIIKKQMKATEVAYQDLDKAVEAIADSVSLENPDDVIIIESRLLRRIARWLLSVSPHKLRDFLLVLFHADSVPVNKRDWLKMALDI